MNVEWSQIMSPGTWDPGVGVVTGEVKATTCLNRFELLVSGEGMDSEGMRKWAHERLDEWLDGR